MTLNRPFVITFISCCFLYWIVGQSVFPFSKVMEWRAQMKVKNVKEISSETYHVYEFSQNKTANILSVELVAGQHFWYPQIAVWIEDMEGKLVETLFVTEATAKGFFSGGRTKENFKDFDKKASPEKMVRVDALPYWSHKRGVAHEDGFYSPAPSSPLPNAITGATPAENFMLKTSSENPLNKFRVLLEINVAFDDNEHYSEYDFPDDFIYHSGTGQLGQPSLVYEAVIDTSDVNKYYLMNPVGHGHHSAQNGILYKDLSKLTTALGIVERAIVKVD